MNNHERFSGDDPEEPNFSWEDNELTDENLEELKKLEVPVGRTPQVGESVRNDLSIELRRRMEELRVEGGHTINKWQLRRLPELLLTPYVLDDVHYAIYERRREKSSSPYVSVSFKNILDEFKSMADNRINAALLQRRQTEDAHTRLVDLGLNDDSLYKMIGNSPHERFLVRCLSRLLREPAMAGFTDKLLNEAMNRGAADPMRFEEVASRASKRLEHKYVGHMALDTQNYSNDEKLWFLLVERELARARAFAAPAAGYLPNNHQ